MKCIECGKRLNVLDEVCPYCGAAQYDEDIAPVVKPERHKKQKEPIFTEEESFLMHIHPNDELYRKTMELDILAKDYRKRSD